jgi:hypothetical protein
MYNIHCVQGLIVDRLVVDPISATKHSLTCTTLFRIRGVFTFSIINEKISS